MATSTANNVNGKENIDEVSKSIPLETPVIKRRVLKLVPKRKKIDLNLSASATKKKKFYQALSHNINLSTSMQKQTMLANNRALAHKLEQTRQEMRLLNEVTMELRRENQELHLKNTKLEAVAGIQNEEIEKEVDKRMVERLNTLKANLGKMGQYLFDATTLLSESMDECALASRRSTCSSRGRSYGSISDWTTPPVETNGGFRRSLYHQVTKTALPEVDGNINGKVGLSVYSLASHDMSVIAEKSVLLESITPPLEMIGGSPIQEGSSAENGEKSKNDSAGVFVNCKPRRVLCKTHTSDADLDLNTDLNSEQQNATNNKTSGMEDADYVKNMDLGSIDISDTSNKTQSDRRGTFVVPPEEAMKIPVRQTSNTSKFTDSSSQSESDSELSGPSKPSKIPKKTCSESGKSKMDMSEPAPINMTSNEDRRKTFVVPFQPDSNPIKNNYFKPPIPDDEVTTYFNTDMEFTEVINENQLFSVENFRSEFMSNNSPQKEQMSKSSCESEKRSGPSLLGKTHKKSKNRQQGSEAMAKDTTKYSAASDFNAGPENTNTVTNSETTNPTKSIVEFRLPKPGKIVFSATRKEIDGTRKPVPSKRPSKTRSKSKVKLSRPVSKSTSAQESPKPIQSIFDFHDKTPRMTSENGSKIVGSVYDLSMNESVADPGKKPSLNQFRQLSNTSIDNQVVDKNSKVLVSSDKELVTDTKSKPRTKSKKMNEEKLVETEVLSEVKQNKMSRTKSKVTAGQNSHDKQENKSPEAKLDSSPTAGAKERGSRLLGDKPVYYLPLKDCSPEVSVTKTRSQSRGRKSQKLEAEDDQQMDQKSRSRSRSRRRRVDSDTENEFESRRSRGRSRTRKTYEENTVDECTHSKSAETQKQDVIDTNRDNDRPMDVNHQKLRTRSRSRAAARDLKPDDPDVEKETLMSGQHNTIASNGFIINENRDGSQKKSEEIEKKSRRRSCNNVSEKRSVLADESDEEEDKDKGKKTVEPSRKSRGHSQSRASMNKAVIQDSDEEEENVDLENKLEKLKRKSRGCSRSRTSLKKNVIEDSDEEENNVDLENKLEKLERKSRGRSQSRASMKKIVIEDSNEEGENVGEENKLKKLEKKSAGCSQGCPSMKTTVIEDSNEKEENVDQEKKFEKLERKSAGCSHSHPSKKNTVIEDGDEKKENINQENKLEKLERKSAGRSHSRPSLKKVVFEDSDEEEKNENKHETLERKSRGRSCSRPRKKYTFEESDEEEEIVELENKLEKLERKSRGCPRSRASVKKVKDRCSDKKENGDQEIMEMDRKTECSYRSQVSDKELIPENYDKAEIDKDLESKTSKTPAENVIKKSYKRPASTKKVNLEEKENAEDKSDIQKELSAKKSEGQPKCHPGILDSVEIKGILDSVENRSQSVGSTINLQNVRKRLAALESMRSIGTDFLSSDSQEGEEPDAKRPRRKDAVCYKEPSVKKKMRQPGDAPPSQDSRSKKLSKP